MEKRFGEKLFPKKVFPRELTIQLTGIRSAVDGNGCGFAYNDVESVECVVNSVQNDGAVLEFDAVCTLDAVVVCGDVGPTWI